MADDAIDPSSGYGLSMYDSAAFPTQAAGNIYLYGAVPFKGKLKSGQGKCIWVTTTLLGRALVPDEGYENPDGSPLQIDTDYLGKIRNKKDLAPGPFALMEVSEFILHTLFK